MDSRLIRDRGHDVTRASDPHGHATAHTPLSTRQSTPADTLKNRALDVTAYVWTRLDVHERHTL